MERKKEFKFYEAPEMEVVDVELEGYLLEASDTSDKWDLGADPTTPEGPGLPEF